MFLLSTYSMLQDVLRLGKNEPDISRLAIIVKADYRSAVSRCPGAKIRDSVENPFAKYKR